MTAGNPLIDDEAVEGNGYHHGDEAEAEADTNGHKLNRFTRARLRARIYRPAFRPRFRRRYVRVRRAHLGEEDGYEEEEEEEEEKRRLKPKELPGNVLAWLLGSGVSEEQFMNEYWEKKPLVISAEEGQGVKRFSHLFSTGKLKELLVKSKRLCKKVNICKYEDGQRQVYTPKAPTAEHIWKLYNTGCTLQVFQPQQYVDILAALCSKLEDQFGSLVGSNAYLTPPEAQGLAPHYDDVDVFVIQLEGEKTWRLHEPPKSLPREHSEDLELDSLGPLIMEVTLTPGSMLYMPRGTVHYAKTQAGQASHHLTISTYQQNSWFDFLKTATSLALTKAFENDERYRQGMPVNYLSYMGSGHLILPEQQEVKAKRTQLIERANILFHDLANSIDWDHLCDEMSLDFVAHRLPPSILSIPTLVPLPETPQEGTRIRWRFPAHVRLLIKPNVDAVLVFFSAGNDVATHMDTDPANPNVPAFLSFPKVCAPSLALLSSSYPALVEVNSLPGLSVDVANVMIENLKDCGLLEVFD